MNDATDATPQLPQYIDATMRSCYRQCPTKFYSEFICGLRPTSLSLDLHAGGCFASSLERVYKSFWLANQSLEKALEEAHFQFLLDWGDVVPTGRKASSPKTKDRVWEAVEDYFRVYPPQTDPVQPYRHYGSPAMEFSIAIPLPPEEGFPLHPVSGEPFIYAGRFDMLGEYHGRPVGRDEKTTTSIGASWAEQWDLRGQFLGYIWASQRYGIEMDTMIVRGVGILKSKISHAEVIKVYPEFLIDRWYEQLKRDVNSIVQDWNSGVWDMDLAEACSMYGGCHFRDLCRSAHPERWYKDYEVRRWNPLQKNPIADYPPERESMKGPL